MKKIASAVTTVLLITGILTFAINIQRTKSESKTWTVDDDGPADFSNMEKAVEAASTGDTIWVMPGHYYVVAPGGALRSPITKPLTLIGHNSILDGRWGISSGIVRIKSNNVIVKGFTIKSGDICIDIEASENVIIENNTITDCHWGIRALNVRKMIIKNNTIFGIKYNDGIYLKNSDENIIVGNNLTNIGDNNILRSIESGIHISGGKRNVVAGNLVANSEYGLYPTGNGTTLIGNKIVKSYVGIVNGGAACVANTIAYNEYGADLSRTSFYWNNLIENIDQLEYDVQDRYGRLGSVYPRGGNHWSDYEGLDLHSGQYQNVTGSDGIGDSPAHTPYDAYPLMGPTSALEAGTWNAELYYVYVSTHSSSTITNFIFVEDESMIDFILATSSETNAFSRIVIPKTLLWSDNTNEWTVLVNGREATPKIIEDSEYTYFYLTHDYPNLNIQIKGTHVIQEWSKGIGIPEYILYTIIVAIIGISIVAAFFYRKKKISQSVP